MAAMTTLRTDKWRAAPTERWTCTSGLPTSAPTAAILVIQEIFGVGPYIRAVAERLADAGYLVGAPDVFWRFAPNWESDHTEAGLGASMEKVQQLDFPKAIGDCIAALAHLRRATRHHGGTRRARLLPRRHPCVGRGRQRPSRVAA